MFIGATDKSTSVIKKTGRSSSRGRGKDNADTSSTQSAKSSKKPTGMYTTYTVDYRY